MEWSLAQVVDASVEKPGEGLLRLTLDFALPKPGDQEPITPSLPSKYQVRSRGTGRQGKSSLASDASQYSQRRIPLAHSSKRRLALDDR